MSQAFISGREDAGSRIAGDCKDSGRYFNERRVKAAVSGEDTLYAKIENQLIRVQEMMQGRRDVAEQSRDEIQKQISEIAHQMRTPFMNLQTYLRL